MSRGVGFRERFVAWHCHEQRGIHVLLAADESAIHIVMLCEFRVRRGLAMNPAILHHDDAVRILNRRNLMCDHDECSVAAQFSHRHLDRRDRFQIHAGRGLVKNENRRIHDHGARDGNPLPFSAGKILPARPDLCVISVLERTDEFVRVREARRRNHARFVRVRTAVSDVIADRQIIQFRFLRHITDKPPHIALPHLPNIRAAEPDGTGRRIIKAQEQLCERGFAVA